MSNQLKSNMGHIWETMNTDHVFFHHCQTMNQFDHSSFYNNPNFSTCTYPSTIEAYSQAAGILEENLAVFFSTPRMETQQNSSNFSSPPNVISFSNSPIATTAAPKYFENLNASVKSEVPSSRTTINFSSSAISIYSDFEDSQHTIQELGFDTQKKSCSIRTGLQAQGHVLAERKRRQQLSQRIIALSALIPDLKKLDKASVLGDAIKYIKQLKERVKTLEEKSKKCSNKEPVVTVKRARLLSNYDDSIFSDENSNISTERSSFPDIEVRASAENVLINIYCNKQSARIKEIFSQVENLNLNIISSSAMPIGDNITNITIIAQMDYQWSMTAQHDANRTHGAIMKLISGQEEAALLHHKEFQDF